MVIILFLLAACLGFYLSSVFLQVLRIEKRLQDMIDSVEDFCLLHYPAEEKKTAPPPPKKGGPGGLSQRGAGTAASAISSMMNQ